MASAYEWRTGSDTEVLLAAYETWGERCVEHLEGMYALAILDRRPPGRANLFLARDPAGEKPLYLHKQNNLVLFASEFGAIRRLAAALGVSTDSDPQAIAHYLAYGYTPVGSSISPCIETLPPGATLMLAPDFADAEAAASDSDLLTPGRNPRLPRRSRGVEGVERVEETRQLVQQAVADRLVSDVPLGCLLSGGIDSSLIALCMKRAAVGEVRTFSIGFDDDPRYDESQHAAEVARHLGTTHREFRLSAESIDVESDLQKLATVFGEPFADSSAIPTQLLARETRKEVTVALGGDGGDELFGGYDRYRALSLTAELRRVPGLSALAPLARLLPAKHPKAKATRARRLLESLNRGDAERYAGYTRIFSRRQLAELAPDFPAVAPYPLHADQYDNDLIAAAAALDRRTYLPGDLLVKLDRCSMLHGLEVRAPFMDRRLLRLAATLRGGQLVRNGRGKALLRAAFAAALPPGVFNRRKMGFAVPIGTWFRGRLRDFLHDHLFASDAFSTRFDPPALRRLFDEHAAGTVDHSQRLYALLMLELWWRNRQT